MGRSWNPMIRLPSPEGFISPTAAADTTWTALCASIALSTWTESFSSWGSWLVPSTSASLLSFTKLPNHIYDTSSPADVILLRSFIFYYMHLERLGFSAFRPLLNLLVLCYCFHVARCTSRSDGIVEAKLRLGQLVQIRSISGVTETGTHMIG